MRLCVGVKGGIADDTGTTLDMVKGTTLDMVKGTTLDIVKGTNLDMVKGTTLDMGKGTPLVPKPVGPLGFLSDYE